MNAMIYAAGFAAVLTAGVIHTVIATRELLGCGKELSAWKALKIAFRLLPALIAVSVNGTGYASFAVPADVCGRTAVILYSSKTGENAACCENGSPASARWRTSPRY
ncbi:MAG: hypothetical protein IJJ50_08810 [Lachnospiraceae bacterium]|nr:hypothetical protein [Lachnospiraceae bacterium]